MTCDAWESSSSVVRQVDDALGEEVLVALAVLRCVGQRLGRRVWRQGRHDLEGGLHKHVTEHLLTLHGVCLVPVVERRHRQALLALPVTLREVLLSDPDRPLPAHAPGPRWVADVAGVQHIPQQQHPVLVLPVVQVGSQHAHGGLELLEQLLVEHHVRVQHSIDNGPAYKAVVGLRQVGQEVVVLEYPKCTRQVPVLVDAVIVVSQRHISIRLDQIGVVDSRVRYIMNACSKK
mmetsp:Transcript_28671/g.63089  ORF Transcript_28671/g.63089 Transcript_28671/m.63089 type:complete len:233 (-) Transcript_28671:828-1526(-)